MSPQKIYLSVINKLSKNLGTDNITADKPRVALTFNENQIRRVSLILENKRDDTLREIQKLLIANSSLNKIETKEDRVTFALPKNYFEISSVYGLAAKGTCEAKKMFLWEIKDPNYNEVLSNEHLKPSFEYQEIPYVVNNNSITVFKNDTFDIDKVFLTYYKYPTEIDIAGYVNLDNQQSIDIEPELDDRFTNKVIAMTVEDFQRNYQDQLGHSMSKDRVINNN